MVAFMIAPYAPSTVAQEIFQNNPSVGLGIFPFPSRFAATANTKDTETYGRLWALLRRK